MGPPKRHDAEFPVDEGLVRRLLQAQFKTWADLPLELQEPSGTDHTIYRLGEDLVVRMPIMEYATLQAVREARWLPFLAPQLPLEVPTPLAMGRPGEGYPWTWSIVSWIDGERATRTNVDLLRAAVDLARFIRALHACDPTGGPVAGGTPSPGRRSRADGSRAPGTQPSGRLPPSGRGASSLRRCTWPPWSPPPPPARGGRRYWWKGREPRPGLPRHRPSRLWGTSCEAS